MNGGNNMIKEQLTVYTPESELRHPQKLIKDMARDLVLSGGLAWRLTIRDISAQYRQTFLGYLWAILPPLATSLTFILLNRAKIFDMGEIHMPYPVFVITGTIFWQLFVDSLNAPLKMISSNKSMLSKINFPKEALILSGIGQVLFSFLVKVVLLALVIIFYETPVSWTVITTPLITIGIIALGILIGVFLVPFGVLYQDVQQGITIVISLIMFFTPVVYLPRSKGFMAFIFKINPLTPLLMSVRELVFSGSTAFLGRSFLVIGITFFLMFAGWVIYRISLPILIERMEA